MVYDSSCHMYTEYHGGFTLAEYNIQELSNTMNVCYRGWCGWSEQLCSPKYRYYCDILADFIPSTTKEKCRIFRPLGAR